MLAGSIIFLLILNLKMSSLKEKIDKYIHVWAHFCSLLKVPYINFLLKILLCWTSHLPAGVELAETGALSDITKGSFHEVYIPEKMLQAKDVKSRFSWFLGLCGNFAIIIQEL